MAYDPRVCVAKSLWQCVPRGLRAIYRAGVSRVQLELRHYRWRSTQLLCMFQSMHAVTKGVNPTLAPPTATSLAPYVRAGNGYHREQSAWVSSCGILNSQVRGMVIQPGSECALLTWHAWCRYGAVHLRLLEVTTPAIVL